MSIRLGRAICGNLPTAESREWIVTNGLGGYACGTLGGLLTRAYHGLLIAALDPPVQRTLMLAKFEDSVLYGDRNYPLSTNRWVGGSIDPDGYKNIQSFRLEGGIPSWYFALGDALLCKQIWMQQGANTTYIRYGAIWGSQPLALTVRALANYRSHHGGRSDGNWRVDGLDRGIRMTAYPGATPLTLVCDRGKATPEQNWYRNFDLAVERYRGTGGSEDNLQVATFEMTLNPGESATFVASAESNPSLDGEKALSDRRAWEKDLSDRWEAADANRKQDPDWIGQLVLAADQFIVRRTVAGEPGQTVIAGYPWFSDWGRDTAISLPGLTISTGRPDVAGPILRTFSRYLDRGMLPNVFPEQAQEPEYNTVDAILWYFEAVRAYYAATDDSILLDELFPALQEVIDWHKRGTRYQIHLDESDGLIYAGEPGVQLTWMDARIGDWVVTPRIGKPVEIGALWYNALLCMAAFARALGKPDSEYRQMAAKTANGFQRFWNPETGYCFDVLDGPDGSEATLRPNQIFAISLAYDGDRLLSADREKAVVDAVGRHLLASYGLRSLTPDDSQYSGNYGGNPYDRDSVYHQGPVWGWLLGPYACAHMRVYKNRDRAREILRPMSDHLRDGSVGNLSEIFDGDPPFTSRGCFAQAWSVAETLRAWLEIERVG